MNDNERRLSASLWHLALGRQGRTALAWSETLLAVPAQQAAEGESVPVQGPDGAWVEARVKAFDWRQDWALLELPAGVRAQPLARTWAAPVWGEPIRLLARPSPSGPEIAGGLVRWVAEDGRSFQTDQRPFPGFRGALGVNGAGQPVGVLAETGADNRAWLMDAAAWAALLTRLEAEGTPYKSELGLRVQGAVTPEGGQGLLVAGLEADGAALRGGVQIGDLLLAAEGQSLIQPKDLLDVLAAGPQSLRLRILRGGAVSELTLSPDRRQPQGSHQGWCCGRGGRHR